MTFLSSVHATHHFKMFSFFLLLLFFSSLFLFNVNLLYIFLCSWPQGAQYSGEGRWRERGECHAGNTRLSRNWLGGKSLWIFRHFIIFVPVSSCWEEEDVWLNLRGTVGSKRMQREESWDNGKGAKAETHRLFILCWFREEEWPT